MPLKCYGRLLVLSGGALASNLARHDGGGGQNRLRASVDLHSESQFRFVADKKEWTVQPPYAMEDVLKLLASNNESAAEAILLQQPELLQELLQHAIGYRTAVYDIQLLEFLLPKLSPYQVSRAADIIISNRVDEPELCVEVEVQMLQILLRAGRCPLNQYLIAVSQYADADVIELLLHYGAVATAYARLRLKLHLESKSVSDGDDDDTDEFPKAADASLSQRVERSLTLLARDPVPLAEQTYALARERLSGDVNEVLLRAIATNHSEINFDWLESVNSVLYNYEHAATPSSISHER